MVVFLPQNNKRFFFLDTYVYELDSALMRMSFYKRPNVNVVE